MMHRKLATFDAMCADVNSHHRCTKIVCTLGPACWSVEGLVELIDEGMSVARFNFSHGDHTSHFACLQRLREACALRPKRHVAVMLDTKGPEIRTGKLDPSCNGKLTLTRGGRIEIGTDYDRPGNTEYLACSYKSLATTVSPGAKMLVADGSLILKVLECKADSVIAEIMNNATIGEKKNMNLPGAIVDLPTLSPQDIIDLQAFGVAHKVDCVAASFVRKAADIRYIRKILGEGGKNIQIIAKIENQEGCENFDEILTETDGIMVARGDLGMEIPLEKVFIAQKCMIRKCNVAGKPVVTATQMLESMITNPRPTRAECSDVANAVLDGTDCVMLSGETANGQFPSAAVATMARCCKEAEQLIDFDTTFNSLRKSAAEGGMGRHESLASSAVKTAHELNCPFIVAVTETGHTARLLSKYFPQVPITVITENAYVARQCSGYVGCCHSTIVPSVTDTDAIIASTIRGYVELGWCKVGDPVVCVYGTITGVAGSVNMMKLMYVEE